MEIQLKNLSKKYINNLLFKDLNYNFHSDNTYAITGSNGSGKSTLLKIISGYISPSKGEVKYLSGVSEIPKDQHFHFLNICAPYLNLIEDFSLKENLEFYQNFKNPLADVDIDEEIANANLTKSLSKPLNEFSSGMQQRVKLILATCFHSEVLLLDEPTSHLDSNGKEWYLKLLENKINNRLTLIFSNEKAEFNSFTEKIINIDN